MTMTGHSLSIAIFFCWAQNICKLIHLFPYLHVKHSQSEKDKKKLSAMKNEDISKPIYVLAYIFPDKINYMKNVIRKTKYEPSN